MDPTVASIERRSSRRFWQARPEPLPLWPRGFLLIIALVALFLWGLLSTSTSIERSVEAQVAERLKRFGVTPDQVSASGQEVRVTSLALARADQEVVHAYATSTRCDTWAGEIVCPTQVTLDAERAQQVAPEPETMENSASQPSETRAALPEIAPSLVTVEPAVVLPRDHDFHFTASGGTIRLMGEVPDEATRSNVLSAAQRSFVEVVDELVVSHERTRAGYNNAAARAIELLAQLERGQTYWTDGELSAAGLVLPEVESDARSTFARIANAPKLGRLTLTTAKTADVCDQDFASALTASTINFATGSSDIADDSQNLLKALAELANQCPGGLMIEGHTDSVGDADSNQALSQARAAAVVTALQGHGIAPERLRSAGYGESAPIAENNSASGRAANRRIVIRTTVIDADQTSIDPPASALDEPSNQEGESS